MGPPAPTGPQTPPQVRVPPLRNVALDIAYLSDRPSSAPTPGFRVEIEGEYGAEAGAIRLLDGSEELLCWDSAEWCEDPSLLFVIANAIQIGFREGPDGIRVRRITGMP